jgi:hypothetical protein
MSKEKKLTRGCVVFMKAWSGLTGYGNEQCVSSVCEELGTVSLFGHNQHYKIYDIDRIAEYPPSQAENKRLREALEANVRTCKHFDGEKLCNKIARHMYDDYDTGTEYFCDEHNTPHFATNYSGIFKPSEIAEQALKGK